MAKKGIEELRKAISSGEVVVPKTNNSNQESAIGPDALRAAIKNGSVDTNKFLGAAEHIISKNNLLEATGLEQSYESPTHEYEQPLWQDFMSGVWNSFIIGGGEGLANLVPTMAQAAGSEADVFEDWKSNVSEWFKGQETLYSDKANQPIEEFGDITAAHTASALGQGVGFILGIMGGGGAIGAVGKGASTLSKISSATKLMNATEKAAYLAKNADIIAKAEKGAKISNRIGSFMAGTTLMYPSIEKEAKEAGLSNVDASRFALGVSGLVSMTEGAALEWIGKIATKPLTSSLTKEAVRETLKNSTTKNPAQLQKLFLENFTKKVGSNVSKIAESSAVEFGQEFSQTYIEEGAKQLYDTLFASNKEVGKGKFGTDVSTYKTFVEATYGGIIGGLIGGGLGATHIAKNKLTGQVDNEDNSLLNQSLFGYINTSVQNKNTQNIEKLDAEIDILVNKGEITKEEAVVARENITSLTDFAKDYNTANVKDTTALYQLFQLDGMGKSITEVNDKLVASEGANEVVKKAIDEKKSKIELVKNRVQENFEYIFEKGKPETKNKQKFDEKLVKYKSVLNEIAENNIDIESINKKLDSIFNPTVAKKEAAQPKENKFGKVYTPTEGVNVTDAAIKDKKGFKELYDKAVEADEKTERPKFIKEIEETYGMDKESANWLSENMEFVPTTEPKVETEKEIIPGEVESKIEVSETKVKKDDKVTETVLEKNPEIEAKKAEIERRRQALKDLMEATGDDIFILGTQDGTFAGDGLLNMNDNGDVVLTRYADSEEGLTKGKGKTENLASIAGQFGGEQIATSGIEGGLQSFTNGVVGEYHIPLNELIQLIKDGYVVFAGLGNKEFVLSPHIADKYLTKVNGKEINAKYDAELEQPKTGSTKEQETTIESKPTEVVKEEVKETVQEVKQEESLIKKEVETTNKELVNLTDEQIETELETNDNLSTEERKQYSDELARRNEKAQNNAFLNSLFGSIQNAKEQRNDTIQMNDALLVSSNPELYQKIKQHFAKIFPHIPVTEIDNLGQKYGAQILARLVERGIEIDPNKAIQTSLIHEYAHIYLEILGEEHPLVKLAYGIIEGTQFDEDAKRLYPDKSRAEQLNEALTEAIATNSLEKLQTKFEGSALDKFLAFTKRFWGAIKRFFGASKQNDIVELLSNDLILSKKPYSFDLSGLIGINKNQLDKSINPKFVKLKDLIVNNFNHLKLEAIEKGVDYNVRNQDFVSKNAIGALYGLYLKEKSPEYNDANPLFENIVFDGVVDIKELKELSDVLEVINNFTKQLKEKTPQIYTDTQSLIKELFKISLDFNELTEEDFIEDENQNETDSGKSDTNPIKSGKKVSNSVRSILSSILGPDGKRINPDVVFSYVTNIAQKTIGVEGFINELKKEVERKNPIAHSILSTINGLSEPRRNGLLQTITSLISEKSEGISVEPTIKDDGTVKWSFKNPLVNKDRELGDVKSNLEKARNIPEIVEYFKLLGLKDSQQNIFNNPADQKALADVLSKLFGIDITIDMLNTIIDNYPPNLKTGLSNKQNFKNALTSQYQSILTYLEGQQRADVKKKVEWKDISGFVERMYNQVADYEALQVNYLNTRGNAESSIKLGHWASDLISMITNKETGRLETMQKSPIYKNNSVLKYFADKNKVNWAKLDGIKNLVKNETIDYSMTNSNDYHILQAIKFFSSSSTDFYKQSIGVISNRDGMLLFEVPKYSDEKLTKEFEKQRESLEQLLKKQMQGLNADGIKKLVNDFNNLYIYKASLDGNVSLPSDTYINKEVSKIESVLKDNGIYDGLNLKEGDLKKYFLTEALNRIYLSDIFSGPALYHSNPKSKKGAVESFVKRMSGLNSNGSNIELKNPITFVVFDGKKEGIDVSDSFSVYSPNLNKEISDFTGSLSPVGLNSKNNIFQIDAATGKNLYVKASTVNSKGDNLKGLGNTYAKIEQALVQIEKHLGNNANVMLIDKSALKGTESFQNITLEELFNASENNKIEDIAYKFSAPIKIESMKTPFNLNKKLKSVDKQSSIFSTQAMQVQFNNNPQAIEKFEKIAVKYLVQKMGGVGMQSTVAKWLMNTDNSFNDLLKDMNDRDKSITTEILSAVQEYNKANPNRKITSFDNPSLSKIYEQYVSSKLSKSGIRIEMAGNFLHQLPDIENELAHDEVAVPWAMFADSLEKANELLRKTRATGNELKVAVVRIPASAEVSMFAGKVKYFLDTDANVVKLSNGFVKSSGSDHDGDKAMVYRREMKKDGTFDDFSLKTQMFNEFYNNLSKEQFVKNSTQKDLEFDQLKDWVNQEVSEAIEEVKEKKESKDIKSFVNHSGGAIGSDTEWDIIGSEFGMINNKHYWTETKTPKGNTEISKQDFEEGRFESAKAAKRNFGYQYSAMKDSRLIRNWSQVKHSESVFAIGSIVKVGEKLFPNQKLDTRTAVNPSVTGGTGYAVGMAINNNKPVYVFNQTKGSYDIGWYKYDKNINDFIKVETPVLTKNFAGIGTREINEEGKQAIRDVYEKTTKQQPTSVETNQEVKESVVESPIKETTYKSRSINDVIDIAQKMGFGGDAVGRFAIATKLMSLLGSYNAKLNTPIEFRGEKLTNFSNKQLDALALLLQSALDIGNDPVLTETGFTSTTIDVGNAMLLLGVNPETVINLLKSSEIQKLNADYLNKNSVFNLEDKQSFKEFLNKISKDAFGKNLSYEELVSVKGKNVADFLQFQNVANDLSKLISFVQSDKSLPNNAQLNTSVLEGIEEFKKLSFDVSGLMNRELYKHRLDMLNIQSEVYENSLMTSSPMVKSLVKVMSENVTNKFKFQKDVAGQIEHYLAQKQIKTKRINVRDFIYGLSQKMKTIHDAVVLNEPLRFESEIDNDSIINLYKAGVNSQAAYNYALEQLSTYFSKESVAIAEKEVKDYADLMELRKRAEMYKDNSVFDFLRFKEVGNGKVVMSLKPEFKSTDDTKQKFRDDFNKLQELDPQLANEIIEFQLYRYGLNNKIGSFIEGLPMDLNINALALASDLLRSKSARAEIKEELRANLYAKNKSLLPVVKSIQPNSTNKKVVVFEDKIYVRTNEKESFIKLPIGKFDADENFTAYNVSKVTEASNKIDEEQIKKGC